MYPVLVEVPWPEFGIPLWLPFSLLLLFGSVVAVTAARRRRRPLAVFGAAVAMTALALLVATRGAKLAPGPFEVRAWGLAFATSLAVGAAIVVHRAEAKGIARELVARACVAAAIGGVIGARIAWVLLHPQATGSVAGAAAFYQGGLSVWGGLAGALIGAKLASRGSATSLGELADLAAPSFGAGVALTRLGCFLEGCDFGAPLAPGAPRVLTALGTFPRNSPAWVEHVLSRGLSPSASSSLPVHPIELYEAAGGGALVALALALDRRQLRPGFAFGGIILAYLLLRVSLDWLRHDPVEMWVSRALLLLALFAGVSRVAFLKMRKNEK